MGWGGIKNLPPDGDVFGGRRPPPNIVDEAIQGKVVGLPAARQPLFADLKRNLLHQDYLRYFDSALLCAHVLEEVEGGRYASAALHDVVEPALATALEQLQAIRTDAERAAAAHRPLQYDPLPSMGELYRRARPIAAAFPSARGAAEFDATYESIRAAVASPASR